MILCISCVTKVQTVNISINNYGHGDISLEGPEVSQKGSDPRDSLNGNTLELLEGLPLP